MANFRHRVCTQLIIKRKREQKKKQKLSHAVTNIDTNHCPDNTWYVRRFSKNNMFA